MSDDCGTEAERISEWYDDEDLEELETGMTQEEREEARQERAEEERQALIRTLKARYEIARAAAVRSEIVCPVCGKTHIKTTYHKVFCSNQKRKRRQVKGERKRSCKDIYWNTVNEERFERAKAYNQ